MYLFYLLYSLLMALVFVGLWGLLVNWFAPRR
jgi:hypothetical protein